MRIAVTYEDGNVFQHFGHTETFKVYEVEDNKIVSSELFGSNGSGHGALAGLLAEKTIDVLICGGIGQGAMDALAEAGIDVCAGAEGNADEAAEAYLRGALVSTGVNCDHHHDHGEEGGGCGEGGCGGCHGCGPQTPAIEGKNVGKVCAVHYRGTFNDGSQFDSSYDRGEPLKFVCGTGMMIPGFDKAVANMEVGEILDVHLMPEDAYGMPNPYAILKGSVNDMPGSESLKVGDRVYLRNHDGSPVPAVVVERYDDLITFDANHEMAGKELNFTIELLAVQDR